MLKEEKIESFGVNPGMLYAPKSFLVDSFVPAVEEIILPKTATHKGSIKFSLSRDSSSKSKERINIFNRIKGRFDKPTKLTDGDVFIDLRVYSPANISHAIMIHLPLVLLAQKLFKDEVRTNTLVLIFPKKVPAHIKAMFEALEYRVISTDKAIHGLQLEFEASFWAVFRGDLSNILRSGIQSKQFVEDIKAISLQLPKKLFVSRKSGRALKNEGEINQFLAPKGYKRIYMEDHSILEQIALVSHADSIVAIHGAALGLLSFRALFDLPAIKLIELFPPSHMTNVYRVLTHQLGGHWVGVRGRLSKNIIDFLYDAQPGEIRKYSQSDFQVCQESLNMALDKLST